MVTPIDWKPDPLQDLHNFSHSSRQSLVTLIDLKPVSSSLPSEGAHSRQSLVTPIDWKPAMMLSWLERINLCRQSLVTPIDWKLLTVQTI